MGRVARRTRSGRVISLNPPGWTFVETIACFPHTGHPACLSPSLALVDRWCAAHEGMAELLPVDHEVVTVGLVPQLLEGLAARWCVWSGMHNGSVWKSDLTHDQ